MTEKYLYFRTQATLASDDGTGESACFPLSALTGMVPTANGTLTLFFASMLNNNGDALETDDVIVSDSVQLTLTDDNTHKDVIEALVEFFGSARQNMLIIGDDLSTATEYFSPLISGVGTISVAAVVAS